MSTKTCGIRQEIRYSEAFKTEVVLELEAGGIAFDAISRKYGIKGRRRCQNGFASMAMERAES
jgi:hypothetical protein